MLTKKSSATLQGAGAFNLKNQIFYINLLIIKPFFLIKEKETNEHDVDTDFTASLLTVIFGRYDNESPPFTNFELNLARMHEQRK